MEEEIKNLHEAYYDISQDAIEKLWSLGMVREKFEELLVRLDSVVTRNDLDRFLSDYEVVEHRFQEVTEKMNEDGEEDLEQEEVRDELSDQILEKEEELSQKEKMLQKHSNHYHEFSKTSQDILETVQSHRKNIQSYLFKIDQIKAREVTVYRSNIMEQSLGLIGKAVKRGLESKVLSAVVPKKVAQAYFAMKLMQDTKEIIKRDDLVITRYVVDTSYYDELLQDQFRMKGYRGIVQESLVELKSLKNEYQAVCQDFPNESIYQENMKKLEELEKTLVEQALQIEEVVGEYDEAMEYNEQKIKTLSD